MSYLLARCNSLITGTSRLIKAGKGFCPFRPNSEQQREFVESDAFELLLGGGTAGGKTIGFMLAACKYLHAPGYRGLIIRRTFESLLSPDSPAWLAQEWFRDTEATPGPRNHGLPRWWTFPTEGRPSLLRFAHCQYDHDIQRLMGPSWDFVGIEEIGEFATSYVWDVITTRLRRPMGSQIPMRKRATGNPGGPGQRWIFEKLVSKGLYIHSTYLDNPAIDREDYAAKLATMDKVGRQLYEVGDWTARREGRIYPVDDGNLFDGVSPIDATWRTWVGVDLGSSANERTNGFTVFGYSTKLPHVAYMFESYKKALVSPTDVAEELKLILSRYPRAQITVDPGALGGGWIEEFRFRHGIYCEPVEKKAGYKGAARAFFQGALERKEILIYAEKCRDFVNEADNLFWDERGMDASDDSPDHATDSALYAFIKMRDFLSRPDPLPRSREEELEEEAFQRKKRAVELAESRSREKESRALRDLMRKKKWDGLRR